MSETKTEVKTEAEEHFCNSCGKSGKLVKCSKCKTTYYCDVECQKKDWTLHKPRCIPPEKKPAKPAEQVVVDFVECATFEQCQVHLVKHPELINQEIADEMFQKGYLTLMSHPPEIGTRFIRNAQILQYLIDLRKASNGQQDVKLFFARILDPKNSEYRDNFTNEVMTIVKTALDRIKARKKEQKKKEKETAEKQGNDETKTDSASS